MNHLLFLRTIDRKISIHNVRSRIFRAEKNYPELSKSTSFVCIDRNFARSSFLSVFSREKWPRQKQSQTQTKNKHSTILSAFLDATAKEFSRN